MAKSTARSYKNGNRRPARSVVRLMHLWREGRILGPEWKQWAIRGDQMVSPEGMSFSQGHLRAYTTCMQLLFELTRGQPYLREHISRAFDEMDGRTDKRA